MFSLDPNETIVLRNDSNVDWATNQFFWCSYTLFERFDIDKCFREFREFIYRQIGDDSAERATVLFKVISGDFIAKRLFRLTFQGIEMGPGPIDFAALICLQVRPVS